MNNNKYVCPKCGSELLYWSEFTFDKVQKINPKTGYVYKKQENQDENTTGCEGLKCSNCNCDFYYYLFDYNDNPVRYDYFEEIENTWR